LENEEQRLGVVVHACNPSTQEMEAGKSFFVVFFWQYWGLNSRLRLARQVLYHLSHTLALFALYVQDKVSVTIFPSWL
jgi:hypothetical protein